MKIKIAVLIFIGLALLTRADQLVEHVQQALKDQGFYYGEINGETNANLTAAIRRYQIRNGLQVSGELNNETLQSLGITSSASAQPATKPAPPTPAQPANPSGPTNETANASPGASIQPFSNAPQGQIYPSNPVRPGASLGGMFAGTPFEAAPPGVQRNVVISAQIALARRGLYHEEINGVFGSAMEFSLRAYQARTRLQVTGRLDLETLAALRLLPGPRERFYDPSRGRMHPPPGPPVRGEWVPD